MRRLWMFLALLAPAAGGTIPGRYIVELNTEPAADRAVRTARAAYAPEA